MNKVLYRNTIEHKYFEINDETILYLVKSLNSDKYYLKAMHKNHINEMCFDPETLAKEYWIINSEKLSELIKDESIKSKILFDGTDDGILVLSNQAFTKSEVQNIFKIDPVTKDDNISSNTNIAKSYCNSFNKSKSNYQITQQFYDDLKLESDLVFQSLSKCLAKIKFIKATLKETTSDNRTDLINKLNYMNKKAEFIKNRLLAFNETFLSISLNNNKMMEQEQNNRFEAVLKLYNQINEDIHAIVNCYRDDVSNKTNKPPMTLLEFNVIKEKSRHQGGAENQMVRLVHVKNSNKQEVHTIKPWNLSILSIFKETSQKNQSSNDELTYPYRRTRVHI